MPYNHLLWLICQSEGRSVEIISAGATHSAFLFRVTEVREDNFSEGFVYHNDEIPFV